MDDTPNTIVVKFQNNFHAPGFGRSRFRKGIVTDVPAALEAALPRTAKVLKNYKPKDELEKAEEGLAAQDFARSVSDANELSALRAEINELRKPKEPAAPVAAEAPPAPVKYSPSKKGKK